MYVWTAKLQFKKHGERVTKYRPVICLTFTNGYALVLKVTSQFARKSGNIRRRYYRIRNWKDAGLEKPSWADMNELLLMPISLLNHRVGRLDKFDDYKALEFGIKANR